ncbi:MAG: helix-turn-helix transcriptional regulator [Clostridia bacterium]|nr:helix-turn-helix transcriptional regulator [Clostridia bacterium]
MDILEKIDILRIEKGWTLYKLAEESEITQSTLSNMFIRKTQPSIATLTNICNGVNISLSEFFAEESTNPSIEESTMLNNYRKLSNKHKIAVNNLIKDLNNN